MSKITLINKKIQKHIYVYIDIYTYTMKQVNPIKVYNKILYELMFLFF